MFIDLILGLWVSTAAQADHASAFRRSNTTVAHYMRLRGESRERGRPSGSSRTPPRC
jgi:hypothetical protein